MKLRRLFLTGILSLFCYVGSAQIWPGDITDNGSVNSVDLLYWAWAQGAEGPPRDMPSLRWSAQPQSDNWPEAFPDGRNFAFADCNGDGIVDLIDLIIIQLNQDRFRTPLVPEDPVSGFSGMDPEIHFGLPIGVDSLEVVQGDTVFLPIQLGSAEQPVRDFFGVAFQLSVDTSGYGNGLRVFLEREPGDWRYPSASMLQLSGDTLFRQTNQQAFDVAFYERSATPIDGFGSIGRVGVIIEDDLTFSISDNTISLSLRPIRYLGGKFRSLPLVGDTAVLRVYTDSNSMKRATTLTATPFGKKEQLQIIPNPLYDNGTIQLQGKTIQKLQLSNNQGQILYHRIFTQGKQEVKVSWGGLPAGIYTLSVTDGDGLLYSRPLVIWGS